ncbi:hypothetical protein HPP92_004425 [Vanilla planifolia]|uniref:EamA domain-containing protein n=1 Tax=Vanilla planifolia TaxID=51239 RepID=A0A835VGE5_VANPL|nr:hypothetical protein HPP92_004425 [Vanilla planifolia]
MAGDNGASADDILPVAVMVVNQLILAGNSIFIKLAMNDGMDPLVLVAYRGLFASAFIAPFAFFERSTISVAMINLTPAITFLLAVLLRYALQTLLEFREGIIGAAVANIFVTYSIKKKGPLFVAVFSPLMLVFAAVLASFLLPEKLHLGSQERIEEMAGDNGVSADDILPVAVMVVTELVLAGNSIFIKLAMNDGMDLLVLVAYRGLFASAFIAPFAFFFERRTRPSMTKPVLIYSFCSAVIGMLFVQILYVFCIKMTSATLSVAMLNLTPAITFLLAVLLRLEKLGIQKASAQFKVIGTITAVGGAMLLTFYKGVVIKLWPYEKNILKTRNPMLDEENGNYVLGAALGIVAAFCNAVWLISQAKITSIYPCPSSVAALVTSIGAIQLTIIATCIHRNISAWSLGLNIRLLSCACTGIIGAGVTNIFVAYSIKKKGPLFVAVFSPLMLVFAAVLASFLLPEKLHLGSAIGSVFIITGLYLVLWGKRKEAATVDELPTTNTDKQAVDER